MKVIKLCNDEKGKFNESVFNDFLIYNNFMIRNKFILR